MKFLLIVKIIFLITSLFFGVCSLGAVGKTGDRCVVLATLFVTALSGLLMFEMVYG